MKKPNGLPNLIVCGRLVSPISIPINLWVCITKRFDAPSDFFDSKLEPCWRKIFFKNYPWNNCNYLFLDECNFHKKYYSLNFPFIKKYDGKHRHCLVKFF